MSNVILTDKRFALKSSNYFMAPSKSQILLVYYPLFITTLDILVNNIWCIFVVDRSAFLKKDHYQSWPLLYKGPISFKIATAFVAKFILQRFSFKIYFATVPFFGNSPQHRKEIRGICWKRKLGDLGVSLQRRVAVGC
jgi:hypothetical protein